MQIRTEERMPLLNAKGGLTRPSYATFDAFNYDNTQIKNKFGFKEWEFYQISNTKFCMQLTYGHTSYAGNVGVSLIDFDNKSRHDITFTKFFQAKNFNLNYRPNVNHKLSWWDEKFAFSIETTEEYRRIKCESARETTCDIDLIMSNKGDAMCIATPMKSYKFYYNYKKNFLSLSGKINVGGNEYELDENTFALLDSGRGVWPYRHSWYWGSATTNIDGHIVGFNIGWGFGKTENATENMLFIDGKCHKLQNVSATLDQHDYMKPWRFYSDDGRFEMTFTPFYDNFTETDFVVMHNRCHQVFGYYNGTAVMDDGTRVNLVNVNGFCEHAVNRW